MVYDPVRGQVVLFGGRSPSNTVLGGTWVWDGRAWAQKAPSVAPSPRAGAFMAWDAGRSRVVLFGGFDGTSMVGDTWTWDGASWTKLTPAVAPPALGYGAAASLPSSGGVVIAGGKDNAGGLTDGTWTWNGTTWSAKITGPGSRWLNAMTLDESRNRVVMFGGTSAADMNDTWEFTGTTWSQVTDTVMPPAARSGAALAYDPTLRRPVLMGGRTGSTFFEDTWVYDAGVWFNALPPYGPGARSGVSLAQTPSNGELLLFGGDSAAGTLSDTRAMAYETAGSRDFQVYEDYPISDTSRLRVNVATGNVVVEAKDFDLLGAGLGLRWSRTYNSSLLVYGNLGAGWFFDNTRDTAQSNSLSTGDINIAGFPQGGSRARFTKNSDGTYTTPSGLNVTLTTDSNGLTITENASRITRRLQANQETAVRDRNGNGFTATYQSGGNRLPVTVTDSHGRNLSFTYDTNGNYGTVVDPISRTVAYTNAGNKLTQVTGADGGVTSYAYGTDARLSQVTDPRGNQVRLTYDGSGRVTSVNRVTNTSTGAGETTTYSYLPYGSGDPASAVGRTRSVDPNHSGTTTGTVYAVDGTGRVVRTLDALNRSRSSTYTANSNVATLTNGLSAVTTLTYDARNNLTKVSSPSGSGGVAGASRSLAYTNPAYPYQPSSSTDGQGNCSSPRYDSVGNPTDVYAGQGANCDTVTGGVRTQVAYQSATTTCGGKTGQVCTTTNGRGKSTRYTYNAAGDLITTAPPAPIGATTLTPDGVSRTINKVDGKGQTTRYTYDGNDRITSIRYAGATTCTPSAGTCTTYAYDGNGNLVTRQDTGGTTTYTYDKSNRPLGKTAPAGASSVTYDPVGNVKTFTDSGGTVTYTYDDANQLTGLVEPGGSCAGTVTRCTRFAYDANGLRVKTTYPSGQAVSVQPDTAGRIASISGQRPPTGGQTTGSTFISRVYTYGTATVDSSLRTSVTDEVGATTSYAYDRLNRLTGANTGTNAYTYSYDAAGNRLTSTQPSTGAQYYGYNDADQLCYIASTAGTQGGATCPTAPTNATQFSYDANGNQATDVGYVGFSYNARDQLSNVTTDSATTPYTYADARNNELTSIGSTTYRPGLLGFTGQTENGVTTYTTRDPNGQLIGLRTGTASTYTSTYYTLDALGSVIALTENNGTSDSQRFTYDPYGSLVSVTGTFSKVSPYSYASGIYESTSGLIKFGARYYEPATGRFTQPDPSGQEPNIYNYAGCNPINNIDPTGLSFCTAAVTAGLLTIGVGIFTILAATGGGVLLGVAFTASQATVAAGVLTAAAGLEAVVAVYFC